MTTTAPSVTVVGYTALSLEADPDPMLWRSFTAWPVALAAAVSVAEGGRPVWFRRFWSDGLTEACYLHIADDGELQRSDWHMYSPNPVWRTG